MPYERDTDHMTRGVGAIAAADHVSSAGHHRRVQIGRALRKRDRAMSAIAHGALGMVVAGDPPSASGSGSKNPRIVRVLMPGRPAGFPAILTSAPVVAQPATPIAVPVVPPATPAPTSTTTVVTPKPLVPGATVTVSSGSAPAKTSSPPVIAITPTTALPEIPEGSTDHTTRNVVLLAAGAGALAYFLFFRRRE